MHDSIQTATAYYMVPVLRELHFFTQLTTAYCLPVLLLCTTTTTTMYYYYVLLLCSTITMYYYYD